MTAARGFFATWIVFRHIGYGPFEGCFKEDSLINIFDVPTTFFFILSGVIFSWGKPASPSFDFARRFWTARLSRLYPLYFAIVILCAPIGWKSSQGEWGTFLLSGFSELFFIQGWLEPGSHKPWLMVGWFMSSIALCYFLYPLIAPIVQRLSNYSLIILLVLLSSLCWSLGIFVDQNAQIEFAAECARRIPTTPLPIFFMGITLGTLLTRGTAFLLPVVVLLFLSTIYVLEFRIVNGFPLIVGGGLWLIVTYGLSFAKFPAPHWLQIYGECGFTIYMLHWPIHLYSRGTLKALGYADLAATPYYVPAVFVIVVVASLFVHKHFELPAQKFLTVLPKKCPPIS